MPKFLVLILSIFLLGGCSNTSPENEVTSEFNFLAFNIAMGGNEDFSEQYLTYDVILSYKDGMQIKSESIEPVLANWVQERKLKQEIVNIENFADENYIKVEGKVTYNSKELTKKDILKMDDEEKSIKGIMFAIEKNGEKYQVTKVHSGTEINEIVE